MRWIDTTDERRTAQNLLQTKWEEIRQVIAAICSGPQPEPRCSTCRWPRA